MSLSSLWQDQSSAPNQPGLKGRDWWHFSVIMEKLQLYKVKLWFFPIVMYRCESWTRKKAECQKIDAFELWCWRRLWRVPWMARRSNQLMLKEINPEYSLKGLMLKMKLQYFGHLMQRASSLEKTLMLGKIEGRRRRGWQRMRWLDGIINSIGREFEQAPGDGEGQGSLACCCSWGHKKLDMTEGLDNNKPPPKFLCSACKEYWEISVWF